MMKLLFIILFCLFASIHVNSYDAEIKSNYVQEQFSPPAVGTKIELELKDGRTIKGEIYNVTDDKLFIDVEGSAVLGFKQKEIQQAKRWQYFREDFDNKQRDSKLVFEKENKTRQKLMNIVIPKIEIEDILLEQVIDFLRKKSKEIDPDGIGVNIILQLSEENEDTSKAVNIIISNKNLLDSITNICQETKLKFQIVGDTVIIRNDNTATIDKFPSKKE